MTVSVLRVRSAKANFCEFRLKQLPCSEIICRPGLPKGVSFSVPTIPDILVLHGSILNLFDNSFFIILIILVACNLCLFKKV